MRTACLRMVGVIFVTVCAAAPVPAQTMEKVDYFLDSISEKGDRNHIIGLNSGSSWVLAEPTLAAIASDVVVVMRDVLVEGKRVRAAWMFVGGEEIPAKHLEGVYPANQAFLTRVTGSADQGTRLRLADGSELLVPGYNKYLLSRWIPPYKVLVTGNRQALFNLKDGRRIEVQPTKK